MNVLKQLNAFSCLNCKEQKIIIGENLIKEKFAHFRRNVNDVQNLIQE